MIVCSLSVAAAAAVASPAAGMAPPAGADAVGAPGVGDDYFPHAGNGGYDVKRYDLRLRYDPGTDVLRATATVRARADQRLTRLNLDLRKPLRVKSVRVDGEPAKYDRRGGELRVTPAQPLPKGSGFNVTVAYRGDPGNPIDVTGSPFGWWTTGDGAMVVNEPDGASTWFPANDHPTDKAKFTFRITVPVGTAAIANGDLVGTSEPRDGWHTWRWRSDELMTTYLATATIGDFDVTESTGPDGLPLINAIDQDLGSGADAGLQQTDEQLAFFSETFGPYPFGSYGAIVDDDSVGYALETQTRPVYSGPPSTGLVAHEMAHQWFGNDVTLGRWQDIWLNEGFAVYATWLWSEHEGGPSPAERFADLYAMPPSDPFWSIPPGDPGVQQMFAGPVYSRGAMTLQAIRETIGDDDFFELLRRWADKRSGSDGTTPQLRRLAEKISGDDLRDLFDAWLYQPTKPTGWDRADPGDLPPLPLPRHND